MKISLAWVFDHIEVPLHKVDIKKVIELFTKHTAEIEEWHRFGIDTEQFCVAKVMKIELSTLQAWLPQFDKNLQLPLRKDLAIDQYAFVKKDGSSYQWATLKDFGCEKDGFAGAVEMDLTQAKGSWVEYAQDDYIITVDNKSINHRPDLWGHRGIAREIAAYMDLPLKPWEKLLSTKVAAQLAESEHQADAQSFGMEIKEPSLIYRISGWYNPHAINKSSLLPIMFRLLSMQNRPINALVDLTNYVMFDLGQPMHVFDANAFADKTVILRKAKTGEKLELLDGTKAELGIDDIVLADKKQALSLVGIMGGAQSRIQLTSKQIFVEAVGLHAATIRKTAQRLKLRTEASMRFEKSLDPLASIEAVQRFIDLAHYYGLVEKVQNPLISVGASLPARTLRLLHSEIEKIMGTQISEKQVVSILEKLQFQVQVASEKNNIVYTVTPPSFRVTKDISIKEDIIEEIARMFGYDNIVPELARRAIAPFSLHEVQTMRIIKQLLATHGHMHEVRDYLFYDESFLQRLQWYPENAVAILNPVSENWKVLVTSLVPHLLKAVEINSAHQEELRFFEYNSTWKQAPAMTEQKQCSGIIFHQKKEIDFYQAKALIEDLYQALRIPISIKKSTHVAPWYNKYQTADIYCGDQHIGTFGMLLHSFYRSLMQGSGFAFELNAEFCLQYKPAAQRFALWSKYPEVVKDISVMLPYSVSAAQCIEKIKAAYAHINTVELIDMYEKTEWKDQRSLTFRYSIQAFEKTLQKEEIDTVVNTVIQSMQAFGAQIR